MTDEVNIEDEVELDKEEDRKRYKDKLAKQVALSSVAIGLIKIATSNGYCRDCDISEGMDW